MLLLPIADVILIWWYVKITCFSLSHFAIARKMIQTTNLKPHTECRVRHINPNEIPCSSHVSSVDCCFCFFYTFFFSFLFSFLEFCLREMCVSPEANAFTFYAFWLKRSSEFDWETYVLYAFNMYKIYAFIIRWYEWKQQQQQWTRNKSKRIDLTCVSACMHSSIIIFVMDFLFSQTYNGIWLQIEEFFSWKLVQHSSKASWWILLRI